MTAVLYTFAAVVLALVVIAAATALHRAEARRAWRATLHRIYSERRTR